jgi:hypothetical protein
LLCVLFYVVLCIVCVYMLIVLLPPGGYPIAVKYIIYIMYHISYHIYPITSYISYHIYHLSLTSTYGGLRCYGSSIVGALMKETRCIIEVMSIPPPTDNGLGTVFLFSHSERGITKQILNSTSAGESLHYCVCLSARRGMLFKLSRVAVGVDI